jgi:hypothetical protein
MYSYDLIPNDLYHSDLKNAQIRIILLRGLISFNTFPMSAMQNAFVDFVSNLENNTNSSFVCSDISYRFLYLPFQFNWFVKKKTNLF